MFSQYGIRFSNSREKPDHIPCLSIPKFIHRWRPLVPEAPG
jgi:hypothetical protein